MKRTLIALIVAAFALSNTLGQEIKGKVTNEANTPLPYATIKLISLPDSTTIAGGVTREDGTFIISSQGQRLPLLLEASLIGYSTEVVECHTFTAQEIRLKESSTMLDEVAITANRITHKLVPGGLSTAIEGSPLSQLTDIYSVLRGVPLVEVDNETIKVTGKGEPIIYINDRKMTDASQLRNIKPHLVKDIEVITNPGARYSSSVSAVIKIYTRREPGTGLSGQAMLMLDKYMGREMGYYPYLSLNYRLNNWDFFVSGFYNKWQGINHNKDISFIGKVDQYEWENKSEILSHFTEDTYSFTLGANYEDEQQSAGIRYRFQSSKELWSSWSHLVSHLDQSSPVDYFSNSLTNTPTNSSHRPSIYYLRKIGDWKAQVDIDYYETTPTRKQQTLKEGHTKEYELRTLNGQSGEKYQSTGIRIDANGPLWSGNLNVGGELSWVNNEFLVYNAEELSLPDLNSQFRENTYTLYGEYSQPIFQKFMVTLGLRMEHLSNQYMDKSSNTKIKEYTSTNLFPTFSLGGQLWGINSQLSFRSTINRPNYWRLQPEYQYLSRFEYQVGDPNLRPAKFYTTQLMLNKNWITLMLSHNYIVDQLTQETHPMPELDDPTKIRPYVTVLKHINAKPFNVVGGVLILSPIIKWWHPTLTFQITQMIGYDLQHFDKKITKRKPTLMVHLNNEFTLPWDLLISTNLQYIPFGAQDNIIFSSPMIQGTAEISKRWLKDKNLTTSLRLINFNTLTKVKIVTPYTELATTQRNVPRLQFTISYRFNATKDKYKGKGALGSVIDRM